MFHPIIEHVPTLINGTITRLKQITIPTLVKKATQNGRKTVSDPI